MTLTSRIAKLEPAVGVNNHVDHTFLVIFRSPKSDAISEPSLAILSGGRQVKRGPTEDQEQFVSRVNSIAGVLT